MSDPVESVYVTGVSVDKGSVKAYEVAREILVLASANEIQGLTLNGRMFVAYGRSIYAYKASDTTSAHDGATVMVDGLGRRYTKILTLENASPSEIAAAVDGLAGTALAPGGANRVLGTTAANATAWLSGDDISDILDDALGSADWRTTFSDVSELARVDHLPANAGTGMIGWSHRLVQAGDGRAYVCGASGAFNGDVGGNNRGVMRALGVPSGTTIADGKIYHGATAGWFIDSDGWPWSWGSNTYGVLGHGDTTARYAAKRIEWFVTNNFVVDQIVPVSSGASTEAYGVYFIERRTGGGTGRVAFCGYHINGAAGDGTAASGSKTSPVICSGLTNIVYLHASAYPISVLAKKSDGTWYGWGANTYSQLGISGTSIVTPTVLSAMQGWSTAQVGTYTSIAITSSGGARTAGDNSYGQLGIGSTGAASGWQTPTGLGSGVVVIAIAQEAAIHCAAIVETVLGNRQIYTWGYNGVGQLGDGTTTQRTAPVQPAGVFQGAVQDVTIAGGGSAYGATFIRTSSKAYGCGYNGQSNIVNGLATASSTFTDVLGLLGSSILEWAVVGYSSNFGLIVRTDKGCFSGGYHANGAAGTGTQLVNEPVLQPIAMPGIAGVPGPTGPSGILIGTDAGAGSANALEVTVPQAVADGQVIRFGVYRANTAAASVRFNGASGTGWLTVKTNGGADVASGYLAAGLQVVGFVDLTNGVFRLITDPSSTDVVNAAAAATAAANAAAAMVDASWHLQIEDQKSSGTAGGASVAGTQTRVLNTVVRNTIGAALTANVVTLAAGTYEIEWSAPAQASNGHVSSLYNVTAGAVLAAGTSEWSNNTGDNVVTRSGGRHYVTFASSTQIRVDHYTAVARSPNGLGVGVGAGLVEIYTWLRARKLA